MIRFEQVSKAYLGGKPALQQASFHIKSGEMVFIIGHSGAGKSTLLKLITGLETLSAGSIFFANHNISRLKKNELPFLRRQIGMVFQDHQLLMDRTVYENVRLPLIFSNISQQDLQRRVRATLDRVGLLDKAQCYPIQLSGGEQQRVGIARAIVNKPPIILADEPTGNLDDKLSKDILNLFEELNQSGVTIMMATHNLELLNYRPHYRTIKLENGRLVGGAQ